MFLIFVKRPTEWQKYMKKLRWKDSSYVADDIIKDYKRFEI